MFPWQLLLWKWEKNIFTVIIATVTKRKKYVNEKSRVKSSSSCHPYLMGFFKLFTSGRYHKDMKILKILAFNSKWFRFYGIFKKWKIDDREEPSQILHFLRLLLLKMASGLKYSPGYVFWLMKLKNGIDIVLKPTGIEL